MRKRKIQKVLSIILSIMLISSILPLDSIKAGEGTTEAMEALSLWT